MNQPFEQHLNNNKEIWHELAKQGKVNREDMIKALNYTDKYSYAEQNDAVKRLNKALNGLVERNPDNETLIGFVKGMTEASDEMIRDKVMSSFRDLDNVTESDIQIKARKLGIPVDEFRSQFKLVKNRIDEEKGRERRAKEIEEMKWYDPQNWATSDYEKQRYINDPDASIIGKEGNGKWYNKGEAISDLAYGVAGGVADLLPGVGGTVVGPAIRGARDIQHKVTDSKYQKDGGDIAGDFGKDLFVNVGSDVLPTALTRYMPRVVKFARNGKANTGLAKYAEDVYNNKVTREKVNQMNDELDSFGWNLNSKNFNEGQIYDTPDIVLEEQIKSLPENSILRKQLEKDAIITSKAGVKHIDREAMTSTLADFASVTPNKDGLVNIEQLRTMPDGFHKNSQLELMFSDEGDKPHILDYVLEQNKAANVSKNAKRGSKALENWEKYGDRVNKTLATMGVGKDIPMLPTAIQSRQTSKVNTDEREDIDWFKTNYSRDWEAGFIPRGKDDEPIMKAYREWKEEQEDKKQKRPSIKEVL
jgi:hypothetical protein